MIVWLFSFLISWLYHRQLAFCSAGLREGMANSAQFAVIAAAIARSVVCCDVYFSRSDKIPNQNLIWISQERIVGPLLRERNDGNKIDKQSKLHVFSRHSTRL